MIFRRMSWGMGTNGLRRENIRRLEHCWHTVGALGTKKNGEKQRWNIWTENRISIYRGFYPQTLPPLTPPMPASSTIPRPSVKLLPLNTQRRTPRIKKRAVRLMHEWSYRSGLSSAYAWLNASLTGQSVASILMYHSVPSVDEQPWMDPRNCLSAEQFEAQMKFLAEHRHVVSVDALTQQLAAGEPIRRGTVAITFDDGYLNNLRVAAPILAKYELPATLYLATAYISAGENQWIDTLYSAFRARSRHQLLLNLASGPIAWQLEEMAECEAAYQAIATYLIECLPAERKAILHAVDEQLAPIAYPPRLTMTWDEVRELRSRFPNMTIGVHTANHIDLRTHSHKTDEEMQLSIAQVLTETGERPQHLAFPYNRYNDESMAQAAEHLQSAVAVADDPVVRSISEMAISTREASPLPSRTPLFALPRLAAPQSLTLLKSWTNGGFPDVTSALFGKVWTQPY